MPTKCINCSNNTFEPAEGLYVGYQRCVECKFISSEKVAPKLNVVTSEDPMDAFLCEGCQ